VRKIEGEILLLQLKSLKRNENKYELIETKEKFGFRKDFLAGIKAGDTVAVHWKQVVKILSVEEVNNLDYWTRKILDVVVG
jgi:hypothetical protein